MKSIVPFLLCLIFVLSACTQPTPIVTTPTSLPASPTSTSIPAITPTALPTATQPIPHVEVFLAGSEIRQNLSPAEGYHGVYIHELGSPDSILFNPDLELHGASTIKVAIAVVALKVAEENNWIMTEVVPAGQNLTLAVLIGHMIVNHDEHATNVLTNFVNNLGYRFDDELIKMGIPGFNINQRLTTARSMGLLLEGLSSNSLGLTNNQFIIDLLEHDSEKDTRTFPWAINGSLPGRYDNIVGAIYDYDIRIESLGTINFVAADSGLWTTPDGRHFVIVLIGNYDTERGFLKENHFIRETADILIQMVEK